MMARDDGHFFARGNRVGLHYSHFRHFSLNPVLIFKNLRRKKIQTAPESAKSG
jgi:hypothetical protein